MAQPTHSVFAKQLRKWKKDFASGRGLPNLYVASLQTFLQHRDTMIEKFEKFCEENNIKLEVK